MTQRRAPKSGYDFARKRDYRRKVWATFRRWCNSQGIVIAEAHALLMPSSEGDEIEVALNAGFREWNLHLVDANPAIVATLRRSYPRVSTYGVSVDRALSRMEATGIRLACANFDFCGQVSQPLADALEAIRSAHCFADSSCVALTCLRGRESEVFWKKDAADGNARADIPGRDIERFIDQYGNPLAYLSDGRCDLKNVADVRRLMFIWNRLIGNLEQAATPLRSESYLSESGVTMLWSIWQIDHVMATVSA